MKAKFTLLTILALAIFSGNAQTIRYVKPLAAGSGNGSSWANASGDLQAMINASVANDEIWVAAGTYYPTATTDRTISFVMKAGVKIYGDFPNTGNPVFADRNLGANETILSGDIDKNDGPNFTNNGGNSYHVVNNNNNGLTSTAVLDGFTIYGGNANAPTSPGNSGGGMLNISTSPRLNNIVFLSNNGNLGGGMFNQQSSPSLNNVIFSGNEGNLGGGMYNRGTPSPSIINSTFWDNNANQGGGLYNNIADAATPSIKNCIFWGNTTGGTTVSSIGGNTATITYSDIEGGYTGTGNINQNPLFVNTADPDGADNKMGTADDGLKLLPCSPCINTGNNTGVPTTDITGNARIVNTTADMGAFEYQGTGSRLYVNAAAPANGDGSTWANAYQDLQAALAMAGTCSSITEIWVAAGTYYPTAGTGRTISFVMRSGLSIYGDFPATGNPVFADRNLSAYETILSGDIDKNDGPNFANNSGNSYHVVSNNSNGANNTAVLDGFTIYGGNANGTYPENSGGGMLNISASPTLNNVIFSSNAASVNGGAMLNVSCLPNIKNGIFLGNNAGGQGGAIANSNGSPNIINTTFYDNNAGTAGGAMFSYTLSSPTVKNCIFRGNTTGGTTVSSIGGDFAGVTYSDVEGGYAGTGNINLDPLFLNAADPDGADNKMGTADDGLTLKPCSPAINTGNNTGVTTSDIIGKPRIYNTTADMGACEYQNNPASTTATRLYVKPGAAANGDGTTWATAYQDLQTALTSARLCTNINEIWVAAGTYKPTSGTDRSISFEMVPSVAIYGSFAGNETDLTQRTNAVMAANPSVLSGDIDGVPDVVTGTGSTLSITGNAGNSYHVVLCGNGNFNTRLDGFTVSGGNANVSGTGNINGMGGGMYSYNNSIRIHNVTFSGNNAVNGGGLYNKSSSAVLTNVSFLHNKGTYGGGLHDEDFSNVSSGSTFNSVTFTGNAAQVGGGSYSYYANFTYNNCTFSGNHATLQGGGIWSTVGGVINNSLLTANTASSRGGGIYHVLATLTIKNSFLIENSSSQGGGLFLDYTANAELTNVVVAGNSANNPTGSTVTGKGGGVYMDYATTLTNKFVDFINNTATIDGGGVFYTINANQPRSYFSIFWGNRKGTAISHSIYEGGTGGPSVFISCVVEGGDSTDGYNDNVNISEYPRFVNPGNIAGTDSIYGTADDGLALGDCSPAIDNLCPNLYMGITTDILGNTRYFHNKYDVGAYENITSPAITMPTAYTEKTQDIATDSVFMDNNCKIIGKVVPLPVANSVAGNVEIKEWIEPTPYNMVRRHYQVTPANNAATARGRVTLYFTSADFQAYNANGGALPLPTLEGTNNPPNAENIQVVKYSGTSPDGQPGGYPAQTPLILSGPDLTLKWEAKFYSLSFEVTGFSGFFVKTASVTLPVKLLSFTGKSIQTGNLLNWKTANEVNFSHFEIERSTNGLQFVKIGTQPSNTSGNYDYLDATANAASQNYYRLRMVDRDGKFSYSKIIRINNTGKTLVGEAYPNPTAGTAAIDINVVESETWTFSVMDVMGRVLQTFTKSLSNGNHTISLDKLPHGVSYIKIESGSVHEFRKVIKQ